MLNEAPKRHGERRAEMHQSGDLPCEWTGLATRAWSNCPLHNPSLPRGVTWLNLKSYDWQKVRNGRRPGPPPITIGHAAFGGWGTGMSLKDLVP